MKIIKLKDLKGNKEILKDLKDKIFIYPTDTVYGIGCNVEGPVDKIYEIKARDKEKPFSVIVPSKKWIYENCILSKPNKDLIENLLPGPYTIILKYKKVPKKLENEKQTIGVRIFDNLFTEILRQENILFITTSANLKGQDTIKTLKDVPKEIEKIVSWYIDAGKLENRPSRIFDLTSNDIKILRH